MGETIVRVLETSETIVYETSSEIKSTIQLGCLQLFKITVVGDACTES